jgi:hypothetical protein
LAGGSFIGLIPPVVDSVPQGIKRGFMADEAHNLENFGIPIQVAFGDIG